MMTKYFPTPSDRMGFLWTLTSINDCYVIEFGPAGTTHFAIEGVMELGAEHKMNVFTTHMSEVDITFGRHDKLSGAICEVDTAHNPKYIFVMASSVSSLIGIDIKSICFEMQSKVNATLIPVTYGGYDGDYTLGVERALLSLCENIIKENEPQEGFYNIIGSNIDCYNFLSDRTEIESILCKTFDLKLNTCFTAYTSIDEIEQAAKAKYNIVLRAEGIKCAELMKKKFGTPYVYKKPYGPYQTIQWLVEIAQTFSLKANMEYVTDRVDQINQYVSRYKIYVRNATQKQVLIYGEYDTAVGMSGFLSELGLECNSIFIKHTTTATLEKNRTSKPSESQLKEALSGEYYIAMGDDTVRMLCDKKAFFQIANPNMDTYNFYPLTPLVGFNGTLWIVQKLMNFEREKLISLSK